MKVKDIMSRDVAVAAPDETIRSVARRMASLDVGALPVCDGERLQGMITDRDIVVGAVATGRSLDTVVAEVMSTDVEYVFEDDDLQEAAEKLGRSQIRRLPVLDSAHRLTGIVALADLALEDKSRRTGQTLSRISEPDTSAG
jgi:CBS domain-containing protein